MRGLGAGSRPAVSLPPWVAAILTVAGILLTINALPRLADAITPERARSPVSLAATVAHPDPAGHSSARAAPHATPHSGARSGAPAAGSSPRTAASRANPLPGAGGNSLAAVAVGSGLLFAGLGLLVLVGFAGEGPWPGRYVHRIS
jgi:hypothetical protein